MIESDIISRMSGILETSGQNHHRSSQEYRLMISDHSQLTDDDLPSDLQSLSWLTSVDVPRLQQMVTGRMDFSINAQNAVLDQQTDHMHSARSQEAVIHIQNSMQHDMMGMNTVAGNMNHFSAAGQPSPSYQSSQPLYHSHPQQVYTLSQSGQQCSPAGLYNVSYSTQPQYSQPHLDPHNTQDVHSKAFPKPIYSYSCLIAMALKNSKNGSLPVSEIYSFMKEHFPYFKTAPDGWKNSVRHNLSLNKCFEKVENKMSSSSRKGCLWALNPAKIEKMEEEMQKWKRKDLAAIRRSMANPDELDKLITDRPENCQNQSKLVDSSLTHISATQGGITISQLQSQPVMTLSLQSIPLHHHQLQAPSRIAPDSPVPAQTPPLHALPDMSHSPQAQQILNKAATDFLSMAADLSTEVDALDPSIVDFALHGNLWDEMKDESFSLDALGAFSNSPLRLSDCDLGTASLTPVSSASDQSFSDFQVTGLYTAYAPLDSVTSQYMNSQGNKPIALL